MEGATGMEEKRQERAVEERMRKQGTGVEDDKEIKDKRR